MLDFESDNPTVIGTAASICGYLAITAKHVLIEHVPSSDHSLSAIQIVGGKDYVIWTVVDAYFHPDTDIALLLFASSPGVTNPSLALAHKGLVLDPFSPAVGETVTAFGYHSSRIRVSKNPDGSRHIDLDDEPTASTGQVLEIHAQGRDRVMMPFPCYQVEARFDGGMSGGPVFDEYGAVCGIVCTGVAGAHHEGPPISFVCTLWPIFGMMIRANRAGVVPRDQLYPVVDLVRTGQTVVPDLDRLLTHLATPDWIPESGMPQHRLAGLNEDEGGE